MPLDEKDTIELMRRRLEEDVKSNVEGALFRYYRNVGSIIIAVLGAVGISIGWPALVSHVDLEVKDQIKAQVSKPVADAKKAAEEAEQIATVSLIGLETQQSNLNASIGRLGPKFDDIQVRYGTASEQIEKLEEATEEMRQLTGFLRNQAQAEPVKRDEIVELQTRIGDVIDQIQVLADVVESLQAPSDSSTRLVETKKILGEISLVQQAATDILESKISDPRASSTVYIQFAGGKRSDIQLVSDILREEGWRIPGEERIETAAGKSEIRYYHDSDKAAAEVLAVNLTDAMTDTGFATAKKIDIKRFDATNFKTPPVEGILEVWLQIPLR